MADINFTLLQELATKPHWALNVVDLPPDVHIGVSEILTEARTALHLLDLAGIPQGRERCYHENVDARVYLAITELFDLRERCERIADWHSRVVIEGGLFDDYCRECGDPYPCETRRMADGTHEDRIAADSQAGQAGEEVARDA